MSKRTPAWKLLAIGTCLGVVVSAVAVVLTWPSHDEPPEEDSHARMVATLAAIGQEMKADDPFMGESVLAQAEQTLQSLPPNAPSSARFVALWTVGEHYRRMGRIAEAIDVFEQAEPLWHSLGSDLSAEHREAFLLDLALTYLRKGEVDNCVNCTTSDSCIFPIAKGGVHQKPAGSLQAIDCFERLLAMNPQHAEARWLLNVAYMTVGGYPDDVPEQFVIPSEKFESDEPFPRFREVARERNVDTQSLCGGVVIDDMNGDGVYDMMTSTWDTLGQLRFFRGQGDGSFEEQTEQAGLTGIFGGLNLIHADYDNDGDVDVLVLRGGWLREMGQHPNSLLQNDGTGKFTDVTYDSGLAEPAYPTQTAAWADYDNDGDLDLYVGNEKFACQLFRNNGDQTFTNVAAEAGVENDRFTKAVAWGDFDNDRFADLYVSNLGDDNRLYKNNADGTFTDVARESAVTKPSQSFPTWFWDYNNDGNLDLFVASYVPGLDHVVNDYLGQPVESEHDCVYRGDGRGGFEEVSADLNLRRVTQPMGCNFGDLDNDGYPDFYLGTGYPSFEALTPNLMFHNQAGQRFADVTTAGGFGHLQKGHGVAFADLDGDGDQDVFEQVGGFFHGDAFQDLLFDNPGFDNHWIKIKLVGTQSNRSAIGARIRLDIVEDGRPRSIFARVGSGGSFGAKPLRQEMGVGKAATIKTLEVYWPTTDRAQLFHDVAVDQEIEISENEASFHSGTFASTHEP